MPDTTFILSQEVTKIQVLILVITSQNGKLTIRHGFRWFWKYLSRDFEKKPFSFGSNCISGSTEKDIKVTLVSLSLHAERFTVECREYGNMLFSYFEIFIYVSSNFTFDSMITEYFQCHIGLQLHTCLIIIEKNNFNSTPCFEPNPRCSKLFAFE